LKTLEPLPPNLEGPTWRRYTDGSWYLPDRSLGWELLGWIAEYLRAPNGDGRFMCTLEQARFLLWWYAVDERGEFIYRSGTLRRMKGAGKDVIAAAMSLAELCGPVAFSHFDESGDPVGKPRFNAWVQLAAVSYEQTKNTRMLFPALITDHMKNTFKLEVGKTIIYSGAGGRIESLTSSPFAAEGNRPTFVVLNECQYFFEANSGHALAQVIEGNVTKVQGSRKLSICNAHVPGMDSVAERDWDAFQRVKSGDAIDTGVLYDSLEAPAGTPVSEIPAKDVDPDGHEQGLKKLREGIETARGDAVWLPVDSIMDSILDTRNSVSESRRKYLNQVNAAEDSWISPQEWDRCAVTSEALALKPNDRITLGFDGSKSSDWSALVACRVEDGYITPIKVWNPKRYPNEEIPRDDVDATVRACFDKFDVVAFRADVKEFENYVDTWGRDFRRQLKINASRGHPVAFDMRGQKKPFSLDCESFLEAVLEEDICHSGDPILRQHVLNAKRHPTNWGAVSIRKVSRDSSRKIDAAVCAVLAFGARREYLNSKKVRTGHVAIIQ
jgi:hypothetical protein